MNVPVAIAWKGAMYRITNICTITGRQQPSVTLSTAIHPQIILNIDKSINIGK